MQSQTLSGELRLRLQGPVRTLGFANTLLLHVYKPHGFRVVIFASLGGCHNQIEFDYPQHIEHKALVRQSQSLMPWTVSHAWEDPPPYRLTLELFILRRGGIGTPAVIIESLGIQAIEA